MAGKKPGQLVEAKQTFEKVYGIGRFGRQIDNASARSAAVRPKLSSSPSALSVCSGQHTGHFPCTVAEGRLSDLGNAHFHPIAVNGRDDWRAGMTYMPIDYAECVYGLATDN